MIVTCERCASQYQLDETKISPQGVRARCSRCEHALFVQSPARPDADHAQELVRDTLGTVQSGADAFDDELGAAREAVDDLLGSVPEPSTSTPTERDVNSDSVPAAPIVTPLVAPPGEMEPDQSKWRVVETAGWTLVAALVAVCVLGGLSAPNLQPKPWLVESAPAAGFEVRGVSARWIHNAIAGRLYVISGKIRRSPATTPSNVTPLAVQLLDVNGRLLDSPLMAIGPEIPEQSLRDTSPADLVELQNGRAAHFAATAGSWLNFAAVVPALPADAARFEFSPLKSDAGS